MNEDAVWVHFTVPLEKKIKEMMMSNMVLMDMYEDQTNLVIISINGKEKGYRFTIDKREAKINI